MINLNDLNSVEHPYKIVYSPEVDVNGFDFARRVVQLIPNRYTNALYFCCGQGAVGFNLLKNDQAEYMTFVDSYQPALEGCQITANINGWQQRCRFSTDLPVLEEKVDLFVADPPWCPKIMPGPELSADQIRKFFDIDFELHKHMWTWLDQNLTNDGDVFIAKDTVRIQDSVWYDLIPKTFRVINKYDLKFFLPKSNEERSTIIKVISSCALIHVKKILN